ncbi:hypothetical protein A2924_00340 [Candidatus Giovannonibacteria bacterium RIFCSPLOWO2_01_FULL_44_16]|uniref:Uncharacterized protein n=1 Tax=Candidatus Giovannonibacteria bacterium RIFCSPLOWO2_01_FULL_44_16 TaxID=1798348 RepID=A0A1F5X2R4_9BACT|nr:MAG: hypothetical protein A2924_00340 [Candidatus Giovannonibacteria bacterium RIFCSPLOWO2_01_FULL_44_16]
MKTQNLLESFEEELEILRGFADLKYSLFNFMGTFRLKRQFKMTADRLARIASESFCVDLRCQLSWRESNGEAEIPYIGTLKRVVDTGKDIYTAVYVPLADLKPSRDHTILSLGLNCDGLDAIESAAALFLKITMLNDKKLKNLSIPDLLNTMCFKMSQDLYFGCRVNLPFIGVFKPDLTFEPDQILTDTIKALHRPQKKTAPLDVKMFVLK